MIDIKFIDNTRKSQKYGDRRIIQLFKFIECFQIRRERNTDEQLVLVIDGVTFVGISKQTLLRLDHKYCNQKKDNKMRIERLRQSSNYHPRIVHSLMIKLQITKKNLCPNNLNDDLSLNSQLLMKLWECQKIKTLRLRKGTRILLQESDAVYEIYSRQEVIDRK
ncbi:unnamed protein product [Paramecium sonneborni]|uniref:Uncharacterized protein n=1 Tax=Paramecium sonneborni TaxID=65129 RepID=A0A8S1KPB7_9CILI|nr:unnamed protein product [Paramecium sonneborni]